MSWPWMRVSEHTRIMNKANSDLKEENFNLREELDDQSLQGGFMDQEFDPEHALDRVEYSETETRIAGGHICNPTIFKGRRT